MFEVDSEWLERASCDCVRLWETIRDDFYDMRMPIQTTKHLAFLSLYGAAFWPGDMYQVWFQAKHYCLFCVIYNNPEGNCHRCPFQERYGAGAGASVGVCEYTDGSPYRRLMLHCNGSATLDRDDWRAACDEIIGMLRGATLRYLEAALERRVYGPRRVLHLGAAYESERLAVHYA